MWHNPCRKEELIMLIEELTKTNESKFTKEFIFAKTDPAVIWDKALKAAKKAANEIAQGHLDYAENWTEEADPEYESYYQEGYYQEGYKIFFESGNKIEQKFIKFLRQEKGISCKIHSITGEHTVSFFEIIRKEPLADEHALDTLCAFSDVLNTYGMETKTYSIVDS